MATALQVLATASGEVGYWRFGDPLEGTKYGREFAARHGDYYGTSGVPYCAMFITYCLRANGITDFDYAYVPYMIVEARRRGWLVGVTQARAGDIVCFDWDSDGVADHVGFCEIPYSYKMQTIEGNTDGGRVKRRVRDHSVIIAVIRPNYSGAPRPVVPTGTLAVDGDWGKTTTRALQRINGTPIDGIISSQYAPNMQYFPACAWAGSGWQWEGESAQGSQLIAKMQKAFRTTPDGIAGPAFARGLQQYYKVSVDGYIGADSVRAMQRAINRQLGRK